MKRTMKIFFTDGNTLAFSFPQTIDPSSVGGFIDKLLAQSNLSVEADGHMFIIPTQNIKYIDVTPAPEALGSLSIRGAEIIG